MGAFPARTAIHACMWIKENMHYLLVHHKNYTLLLNLKAFCLNCSSVPIIIFSYILQVSFVTTFHYVSVSRFFFTSPSERPLEAHFTACKSC